MKTITALAFLLFTSPLFAQTATLSAPETIASRTYLLVGSVREQRADPNDPSSSNLISVTIWKMTAGGMRADDTASLRVDLTANADINGFLAAIETPFTGEVAGTTLAARSRRHNGRILNYLVTNCASFTPPCSAQIITATIVP